VYIFWNNVDDDGLIYTAPYGRNSRGAGALTDGLAARKLKCNASL